MYAACAEVLGYAAEALVLEGDFVAAQPQLDEAFELTERFGERLALTSMLRLQARLWLGRGDRDRSIASVREALAEARRQDALGDELKALVQWVELSDEEEARSLLGSALARIRDRTETQLSRVAKELLSEPSPLRTPSRSDGPTSRTTS